MSEEGKQWPGYTGQCNPEVWNEKAKPPQPTEKKIGQLTEEQVDEYFREGVVLIEDYFDIAELEAVKEDIEKLVDYLADRLYAEGKIKSKYAEFGFYERLTKINHDYKGANVILHKLGIMPQSIRDLWSSDRLCNAVEQLIGPDIGGHPVWNLRTKTPQDEATTVPWHQDSAYLDSSSYDKHQVCAWIPLLDATASNGCMEFAMRGHKKGMIAMHQCCDGDTHYVMLEKEEMAKSLDVDLEKDLEILPVKYGSMLLFNNCIPHRSLNNLSGDPGEVRWSLDLRWQNYKEDYGFHGLADGITFRKGDDRSWRPQQKEWDDFLKIARITKYNMLENDEAIQDEILKDSFTLDTTITGPWMRSWELTHMNRHTDGLKDYAHVTWHSS
ncbi:uncharacterized protein [Watersipora subatra]|uniref:uncharacterized protein isoform X2 n=1 Tax=Watersipora subatra TaxID=2589382 RepID=UPI00355B8DF0